MNSGGGTMSKELLDYFDFDVKTPSVSAHRKICLLQTVIKDIDLLRAMEAI